MANHREVGSFLREFKYKLDFGDGVLYRDDRGKNAETLLLLEFTSIDRKKVLKNLETEDYCKGPIEDVLHKGPNMWVFGKMVKGHEIYIKITMGTSGSKVLCISFHVAERPLGYPLKTQANRK
jgi:hypothetical protein